MPTDGTLHIMMLFLLFSCQCSKHRLKFKVDNGLFLEELLNLFIFWLKFLTFLFFFIQTFLNLIFVSLYLSDPLKKVAIFFLFIYQKLRYFFQLAEIIGRRMILYPFRVWLPLLIALSRIVYELSFEVC